MRTMRWLAGGTSSSMLWYSSGKKRGPEEGGSGVCFFRMTEAGKKAHRSEC
jgi:hypothetical protein